MTGYTLGGGYQPPPVSHSPIRQRKLRPGRIWYLAAIVIFAAATAWLIYGIFSFAGTVNGLQRVPLPAGGTVHLAHSGEQEPPVPSRPRHARIACASVTVTGLTHYRASVNYSVGSHHGRAVLALNIARPGKFAITASGGQGAGADLAVGGSVARGIVGLAIPAALIILAFIGGLIVFVIRIAGKSAMRREQFMYR